MIPKDYCFTCNRYREKHVEKEKFNVRVYFENDVKIFTTDDRPLIVNEAIVITSDNGNEYYYKLSMIDAYEIERYYI